MSGLAGRLSRATRWLPVVVALSLVGTSAVGWSSAVTVLAQEDSEDQAPADMAAPAADEPMPAADEAPAAEEAMPAPSDTPPAPPHEGGLTLCVTATRAANGTITMVSGPCPPDSP